ncbi:MULTISPECIES: hypothetical protein [Halobacterium]|uniref:hypothetical protein n=1 Tax=Halobacterium TaxID=2239 RepID=UPI0012F7D579|nr:MULTISPECIES: hypothetical protein [Halobacterium]MCG1002604.1 hypothetical protein [Halobacterium noricense]
MGDSSYLYRLRTSPRFLAAVGVVAFAILICSFIIRVRIILEYPAFGDITGVVGTIWSVILSGATLGSFGLAVHNYRTDDESEGPATGFTVEGDIKGEGHEFHLYLSPDGSEQAEENQQNHSGDIDEDGGAEED